MQVSCIRRTRYGNKTVKVSIRESSRTSIKFQLMPYFTRLIGRCRASTMSCSLQCGCAMCIDASETSLRNHNLGFTIPQKSLPRFDGEDFAPPPSSLYLPQHYPLFQTGESVWCRYQPVGRSRYMLPRGPISKIRTQKGKHVLLNLASPTRCVSPKEPNHSVTSSSFRLSDHSASSAFSPSI